MGQDISLKSERETHDLNHDLTFSAHTINCVRHSIRSMFKVLGIYNFGSAISFWFYKLSSDVQKNKNKVT